jgi:hypothetical protein
LTIGRRGAGHHARRRASGVKKLGVGRGVELSSRRMVPALADDMEQAQPERTEASA